MLSSTILASALALFAILSSAAPIAPRASDALGATVDFTGVTDFVSDTIINLNVTSALLANDAGDKATVQAFLTGVRAMNDRITNWVTAQGHARANIDLVLQTAKATGNTELVTLAENAITSLVPGAVAINDVVAGTKFNQTTNPADGTNILQAINGTIPLVTELLAAVSGSDDEMTALVQSAQSNLTLALEHAVDLVADVTGTAITK